MEVPSGSAVPASECYIGVHVLNTGDQRGRIVIANEAIPKGEAIIRDPTFAMSPFPEHKKRMCARCLRYHNKRLDVHCTTCNQAWFCSIECEACPMAAPHNAICTALIHLASARFDKQVLSMLRLILEILYRKALTKEGPPSVDGFEQLVHTTEPSTEELTELKKPFETLRVAVRGCAWYHTTPGLALDLAEDALHRMFSKIECNSFGLLSPRGGLVGHALHPFVAMLNHSCVPNCAVDDQDPRLMTVSTVLDIAAGQELNISYIDLRLPVAARRRLLQRQYHFTCVCERCLEELKQGKSDHGVTNPIPEGCSRYAEDDAYAALSLQSEIKLMNPKTLKSELKSLMQSTQGSKKELVARLIVARLGHGSA